MWGQLAFESPPSCGSQFLGVRREDWLGRRAAISQPNDKVWRRNKRDVMTDKPSQQSSLQAVPNLRVTGTSVPCGGVAIQVAGIAGLEARATMGHCPDGLPAQGYPQNRFAVG